MSEQEFDYQAAQHEDMLIMRRALLEHLLEVHRLVDGCSDYTTLNETDVENIAAACGMYEDYKQALKSKSKEEHEHAHR